MSYRFLRICVVMTALCCLVATQFAAADTLADTARAIVSNNRDAVVTVRLVIENRYSMPGRGTQTEESRSEITGTVIDPSGLVVVSLFTTDPASASRAMMGAELEQMGLQMETEVKSADILLADSTEIPATVVLRDRDLDLAFLRPTEPAEEPFVALDLTNGGTPDLLDPVVAITRLGRVANRAHGALLDRVEAVVDRPRTFYVPAGGGMNQSSLGAPVFTLDGDVVGILLLRTVRAPRGRGMMGMMGMMGGGADNAVMIVLPAEDVLEVAQQAPEHAEEDPDDEAGEEDTEPDSEE